MKIKISSDLKSISGKVLAGAHELRRIDDVIEKTKTSEPVLKAELDSARKRLAVAEVAVELDGASLDDKHIKAVADAINAIERATGRLAGLEGRRAECAANLQGLTEEFEAARWAFACGARAAIEGEIKPLVTRLREAYALLTGIDEALNLPGDLQYILSQTRIPGVIDCTADLLKFEVQMAQYPNQWFGAHRTDTQALELMQSLSEVIEAATALKKAA